jgi:hypothetical protein
MLIKFFEAWKSDFVIVFELELEFTIRSALSNMVLCGSACN